MNKFKAFMYFEVLPKLPYIATGVIAALGVYFAYNQWQ